jgi:hypothetical protein
MNPPLNLITGTFYTLPLMMVFNIIFLAIIFTRKRMLPYYPLFKVYGLLALAQDVLSILLFSPNILFGFIMLVAFFESVAFYSFFRFHARSNQIQNRMTMIRNIFIIFSVLLVASTFFLLPASYIRLISNYYVVACNLVNLILAFLYIYNFLLQPSRSSLLHQSSFWINIGILLLNSLEIPLFLSNHYLDSNHIYSFQAYCLALGFLAYCVMFTCFTIGLLCPENGKGKPLDEPMNILSMASK